MILIDILGVEARKSLNFRQAKTSSLTATQK